MELKDSERLVISVTSTTTIIAKLEYHRISVRKGGRELGCLQPDPENAAQGVSTKNGDSEMAFRVSLKICPGISCTK